jgi:hypothetical protein
MLDKEMVGRRLIRRTSIFTKHIFKGGEYSAKGSIENQERGICKLIINQRNQPKPIRERNFRLKNFFHRIGCTFLWLLSFVQAKESNIG